MKTTWLNSGLIAPKDTGLARRLETKRLQARYDDLWSASVGLLKAGKLELDPILEARLPDQRRGLTVIARLSSVVRGRVVVFLRQLRHLEPDQHYYAPSELHLTILSLFTATVDYEPLFAQKAQYVDAVDAALKNVAPIHIHFEGVTLSPSTVMIQGFFETNALNELRDSLRVQLGVRGLAEGLDRRYRLETAHMTVARFRAPLRDSERFVVALDQARRRSFGCLRISSLSLVSNDWYMTHNATKTIKRYRLAELGRTHRIPKFRKS